MSDQREMTLDEYLESKLPDFHLARRQLQELHEENATLAAHVEAGREAVEHARQWVPQHVWTRLWLWKEEAPTTSLARLKAEWQADELSAMIAALPFGESLARGMLKHRRDELRSQAEGGR